MYVRERGRCARTNFAYLILILDQIQERSIIQYCSQLSNVNTSPWLWPGTRVCYKWHSKSEVEWVQTDDSPDYRRRVRKCLVKYWLLVGFHTNADATSDERFSNVSVYMFWQCDYGLFKKNMVKHAFQDSLSMCYFLSNTWILSVFITVEMCAFINTFWKMHDDKSPPPFKQNKGVKRE